MTDAEREDLVRVALRMLEQCEARVGDAETDAAFMAALCLRVGGDAGPAEGARELAAWCVEHRRALRAKGRKAA